MIGLKVSTEDAEKMLASLETAINDFTPVWPKVEKIVMDMEREHFVTEGEYGTGQKWEPLNDSYAEWKRKTYGPKPILQRTGLLFQSLTTKGQGHFFRSGPNFVEVGTSVSYAGFHQRGNANLPQRTVVPVPPKEIGEAIADVFMAYIFSKMRQGMGR